MHKTEPDEWPKTINLRGRVGEVWEWRQVTVTPALVDTLQQALRAEQPNCLRTSSTAAVAAVTEDLPAGNT